MLHNGKVSECSVIGNGVGVSVANEGNNNFVIAGLIGNIVDNSENTISSDKVDDYVTGCSVIVLETDYSKEWGLLIGRPVLGHVESSGGSGGTSDAISAIFTVNIYEMQLNGTYLDNNPSSTQTYVGLVGDTVTAEYILSDGYDLDESESHMSDVVKKDGSTVLSVNLKIVPSYKITIPSTLVIKTDTKTGTLPITATELWILDYGWVDVSVSSEYDFNLSYEGKQEGPFVKYELRLDNSIINENSVAVTFSRGSSKPGLLDTPRTVSLTAELTGHPPYVGSYNDILTFTAEYKESAPANR